MTHGVTACILGVMSDLLFIHVKVTPDLRARLDAEVEAIQAREPGTTKSDVIRRALVAHLSRREKARVPSCG